MSRKKTTKKSTKNQTPDKTVNKTINSKSKLKEKNTQSSNLKNNNSKTKNNKTRKTNTTAEIKVKTKSNITSKNVKNIKKEKVEKRDNGGKRKNTSSTKQIEVEKIDTERLGYLINGYVLLTYYHDLKSIIEFIEKELFELKNKNLNIEKLEPTILLFYRRSCSGDLTGIKQMIEFYYHLTSPGTRLTDKKLEEYKKLKRKVLKPKVKEKDLKKFQLDIENQ